MFVKTSLQQRTTRPWSEDVNRVQDQYEASKVNVITCLPNGEERCLSFLKEEGVVVAMARELGVRSTQICVSFTDNVVGNGADGRRLRTRDYNRSCKFKKRTAFKCTA